MRNQPVISTAKVRGMIKKNGIRYVDATGRLYPSINSGISVWQLCDSIYFKVYGRTIEQIEAIEKQFAEILATEGFTFTGGNQSSYQIVKIV